MGIRIISLEIDDTLYGELAEMAIRLKLGTVENALRIAAADWISRRKTQASDEESAENSDEKSDDRYFVNQALDELITKKR